MGQLAGTIAKLQRLREALSNVRPFYAIHLPKWQERARRIAIAVMENARPDDVLPEVWRHRVATEAARLSALLDFGPDEAGAIIAMGVTPPGVPEGSPRTYSLGATSIRDVERWVQAGRQGEDLGKNLKEMDAGKSNLQIAWRVMWALKLGKPGWERLLGHIREYLGTKEEEAEGIYGGILQAWLDQLGPEIREDFRDWVRLKIAQSFQAR